MENSCSTSPAPETTAAAHTDGNKCKAEHTPSPDKGTKNHSDHMNTFHVYTKKVAENLLTLRSSKI